MKSWYSILPAFGLALAVGCDSKSPPGGPGANTAKNSSTGIGTAEQTFKLTVPTTETTLSQGETKTITIGMTRGKNFDQDVNLKFGEMPKGVTVDPMSGMLRAADKEWKVSLTAAADAALGQHTITVTGTPTTGSSTSTTINVEVKKP